jgi:hypothetical protein
LKWASPSTCRMYLRLPELGGDLLMALALGANGQNTPFDGPEHVIRRRPGSGDVRAKSFSVPKSQTRYSKPLPTKTLVALPSPTSADASSTCSSYSSPTRPTSKSHNSSTTGQPGTDTAVFDRVLKFAEKIGLLT